MDKELEKEIVKKAKRAIIKEMAFGLLIGIAITFMFVVCLALFTQYYQQDRSSFEEPIKVVNKSEGERELTYNTNKIDVEVLKTINSYFEKEIYDNIDIKTDLETNWQRSNFKLGGGVIRPTIKVGLDGIRDRPKIYKLIVTHEYIHFMLYRHGLKANLMHEALTDTFTYHTNRETSKVVWGKNNEARVHPYSIISSKLIKRGTDDCLYSVFNVSNKITKASDIINRLEKYCDIDIVDDILNEVDV